MRERATFVLQWALLLAFAGVLAVAPEARGAARLLTPAGDGRTNNCEMLREAMNYAEAHPGTTYNVPNGRYAVWTSACTGIAVPPNTTIACASNAAVFQWVGDNGIGPLFTVTNPINVHFRNCGFAGNNRHAGGNVAGAILFIGIPGAKAPMGSYGCTNCAFSNFGQDIWVFVTNQSSQPLLDGDFSGSAQSLQGNDRDPTTVAVLSAAIVFGCQVNDLGGFCKNNRVHDFSCDATWIKQCLVFYGGTKNDVAENITAKNCGRHTEPDSGGYCITIYPDGGYHPGRGEWPTSVHLNNIACDAPFSACVYSPGLKGGSLTNATCSGQTDTATQTLQKGCFVFGDVAGLTASHLRCQDSYQCVTLSAWKGSSATVSDVRSESSLKDATGAILFAGTASDARSSVVLQDFAFRIMGSGGACVRVSSGNDRPLGTARVGGGTCSAATYGIQSVNISQPWRGAVATGIWIGGVTFSGAPFTSQIVSHATTATPLTLDGVTIDCAQCAASTVGVIVTDATAVTVRELIFKNRPGNTPGKMFVAAGARGAVVPGAIKMLNVSSSNRYSQGTTFGVE